MRVKCKSCNNLILQSTADANAGRCGQCAKGITPDKRVELAEFLETSNEQNVRDPSLGDVPLEYFGRFLMRHLRDSAIGQFEGVADGRWNAPSLTSLQAAIAAFTPEQLEVVRRCVVDAVDNGIHDFLFALVEERDFERRIEVLVDGKPIVEASDGLHGELFTKEGWQAQFSEFGEARPHSETQIQE